MEPIRELDRQRIVGCAFIVAMVAAPFIALIYGLGFALLVLTVELVLTAFLAYDARDQVDPGRRTAVLLMAGTALLLALITGLAALTQFR